MRNDQHVPEESMRELIKILFEKLVEQLIQDISTLSMDDLVQLFMQKLNNKQIEDDALVIKLKLIFSPENTSIWPE